MSELPNTAEEWDFILSTIWLYLTPVCLSLAAIILVTRLATEHRWRSRMARASALLILSYAILMLRLMLRQREPDGAPDPFWAAFYTFSSAYFLYAILREWSGPFAQWMWLKIRRPSSRRDGIQ